MPNPTSAPEVTQRDKDAAIKCAENVLRNLEGDCAHEVAYMVKCFARHREENTAGLRSILAEIEQSLPTWPDPDSIGSDVACEISLTWDQVHAIRNALHSGQHPPAEARFRS